MREGQRGDVKDCCRQWDVEGSGASSGVQNPRLRSAYREGLLIKSGRRAMIRTARCCEGSPFLVENHGLAGFLRIPCLLLNSVVCEELTHKISTHGWGEPLR